MIFKIYIDGVSSTGKSYIINKLYAQCNHSNKELIKPSLYKNNSNYKSFWLGEVRREILTHDNNIIQFYDRSPMSELIYGDFGKNEKEIDENKNYFIEQTFYEGFSYQSHILFLTNVDYKIYKRLSKKKPYYERDNDDYLSENDYLKKQNLFIRIAKEYKLNYVLVNHRGMIC